MTVHKAAYDFGIYRGEKYAGTKIMRVADFVEFCKTKGVCAHLELKEVFTEEKLDELVAMIIEKGMDENIMINGQNADNLRVGQNADNLRVMVQ